MGELEKVRLALKESQEKCLHAHGELFSGHAEILETLGSMSAKKRKGVLENLYAETKKIRLEKSGDEMCLNEADQESADKTDKNDSVTDGKPVHDSGESSVEECSPSIESVLTATPLLPIVKTVKPVESVKPTSILFCNWAKANDEGEQEEVSESESEDDEEIGEKEKDCPQAGEQMLPTLEDFVCS